MAKTMEERINARMEKLGRELKQMGPLTKSNVLPHPWSMADVKIIDGKKMYAWGNTSKQFAEKEAAIYRKRGFPARIIKRADGYQVFTSAAGIKEDIRVTL